MTFDLASTTVRAIPAVSGDSANPLQTLPDMATQNEKFIAGINGGYFWRVESGLMMSAAERPVMMLIMLHLQSMLIAVSRMD